MLNAPLFSPFIATNSGTFNIQHSTFNIHHSTFIIQHSTLKNKTMTTADVFQYVNQIAMVGWLLLIVAPKWQWTKKIVLSGGITMIFAVTYLVLFVKGIENFDVNSFSTLEGVMALFTVPEAVLMGWVHYLAFDLFVGMWEVTNAQRHGISHWLVIPCLFLTFMLGPIGLLTYMILRLIVKKGQLASNF
jgi:hypothetical protein